MHVVLHASSLDRGSGGSGSTAKIQASSLGETGSGDSPLLLFFTPLCLLDSLLLGDSFEGIRRLRGFQPFEDCIGAIDGTHVSASVPLSKQIPYRGRKGDTTWNVMCACDLDMKFTFVYAGWEGSANDCRVFNEALNNPKFEFPHPPPGKYYVVDSGYPSTTGFLTPFKGQRYHLNDYRNRRPRTAVELFNNRHSSVRNVIERSFGSLKKRFPILSKMPCFPLNTQTCIVIACCALHNFIREEEIADKNFKEFGENWWNEEPEEIQDYVPPAHISISLAERRRQMDDLRKKIANELAVKAGMAQIT